MSGMNLSQVYAANPITSNTNSDLMYFVQGGVDAALLLENFVAPNANAVPVAGITGLGTGVATALAINIGSAGAPVTFNGAGGTPSSITLTHGTGLPIATGVSGLGTGVATALAVNPGSAGAVVLFNGALGTPSSGTLTSCTGLPISTGVSGLGTGVATALAVNTGSAGAVVLFNGALGTPSSGTLTSCTGLPVSTGISGLGTGVATALAVNTGSAGAVVLFNGAGGTPSSMVGTNITGTAAGLTAGNASAVAVGGITGLGTGVATALAINVGSAGAFVTFNGALGTPSSGTLTNCTGLPSGAGILCSATNNNASAGQLGEFVSSVIASASAVSLSNNTAADVTSISLTAGDWDVWGNVSFPNNTGTVSYFGGWISSSSASIPDASLYGQLSFSTTGSNMGMNVPSQRFSLSGTTTIYLSVQAGLTVALKACGGIYARRRR